MLQELAVASDAQTFVIGALVFFVAAFAVVVSRVLCRDARSDTAAARLPLDDGREPGTGPEGVDHG